MLAHLKIYHMLGMRQFVFVFVCVFFFLSLVDGNMKIGRSVDDFAIHSCTTISKYISENTSRDAHTCCYRWDLHRWEFLSNHQEQKPITCDFESLHCQRRVHWNLVWRLLKFYLCTGSDDHLYTIYDPRADGEETWDNWNLRCLVNYNCFLLLNPIKWTK